MKTLLLFLLPCLLMFYTQNSSAQANTELSNLVDPTKVNVDLLPGTDNTRSIGSMTNAWKDVYLAGDVYINDERVISLTNSNSFVGHGAGVSNTYGHENSFFGLDAGHSNGEGSYNTFMGIQAGYSNYTGVFNSFFGYKTGCFNTGSNNSFFGEGAGSLNTTGCDNCFYGSSCGNQNSTGNRNSFVGKYAGFFNTTANDNSFFGYAAAWNNTTGLENSFFGKAAGFGNTTGTQNSFFGKDAGYHSTGNNNSFFGKHSGYANTNGDGNTFIGNDAGDLVTIGDNNTSIGFISDIDVYNYTNSTAIGYNCSATASNQTRIGTSYVTSIGGYVGWTDLPSDVRFKKNVKENVPGLEFITRLRPITYTTDVRGINQFITSMNEDADDPATQQAIRDKEQIVYTGFIAQEVEASAKELGYDFSGVDAPKNEKDLYGLRYAEFVVPLVKAVQELDEENRKWKMENTELKSAVGSLKSENENLKIKNEDFEKRIAALENQSSMTDGTMKLSGSPFRESEGSGALLGQNIPNPFDNSTIIPFRIPKDCNDASIVISESATGKIVRVIPIACGETQLALEVGLLASGTYSYSLIVDGKLIDAKQMVLTK